jgi:UDP-3-O-[3-hydroxymyristoyl] glucosamine N-acyltransferase
MKDITLNKLLDFLGDKLIRLYGDSDNKTVNNLRPSESVNSKTLDWINKSNINKQDIAENSIAKTIICDKDVRYTKNIEEQGKVLLVVNNPKVTLALIAQEFFVLKKQTKIDLTANISKSAKIGINVSIGAYSVVGENCTIGNNTVIDSNCIIYNDVRIGNNCRIKSSSVLGGEGFGYEYDDEGNLFRFPQLGKLIIGNYVDIGSNTCIDRGSLSDTFISDHCKINNLCHIAHNNFIGKNTIVTSGVSIAGSNHIGTNVWIAPNSSIKGWLKIGDKSIIGMGSVVTKNISNNETWYGNPARKIK